MRLAAACAAALVFVLPSLGCENDSPEPAAPPTTSGSPDPIDPDPPIDPEPAVGIWLGTREMGSSDNDSFYDAIPLPNGDVVLVGASATPGLGAEGSRWTVQCLTPSGATRWTSGGLKGAATRGVPGPDGSVIVVGQYNVARYDADGSERWHALDNLWVNDVDIDLQGRVVVGGLYAGGPFLDDATLRPAIGATGGTYDGYVIRLDADDGHVLDRVQIGTGGSDWVNGLAVGPEGGVYLTGPTEGTFPGATHVDTDGNSYVMRLHENLKLDWATQPTSGYDQGYALRLDGKTNQLAVLAGHGSGLLRLDAITGDLLSNIFVAGVAGTDLAIDAQSRVWFVGSTHEGPSAGMVTIIDPDNHVADPLWFVDSPPQGISTEASLRGIPGSHSYGVAVDAAGFGWIAGDARGDLEQAKNSATLAPNNSVDPNEDSTVARITPDLRRDRPRFLVTPAPTTLAVGESLTLTVHIEDGSGAPIKIPPNSLAWRSALPDVASITNAGVVTAHAGGRTRLEVWLGPAHSEPLELVVADPKAPERGSVVFIGADHGDVATVVVADPLGDAGAVLVGGWTDGPLAHRPKVAAELADYDVMRGERDVFIAEVAGDGTFGRVLQLGGAVYDSVQQILPRADGSLLLRAVLSEPHGINYPRTLVTAIDRDGHELWHYPDDHWTAEEAFGIQSMAVLPSGRILVGGQQKSMLLAELDPDTGLELWRWLAEGHVMGGGNGVVLRQAGVTPEGTIVVIGDDDPPWRTWELGLDPTQTEPIFGGPKVLYFKNTSARVDLLPGVLAIAPPGAASGDYATLGGYKYGVRQDGNGSLRANGSTMLRFGPDGALRWESYPMIDGAQVLFMAGLVIDGDGNTYVAGSLSLVNATTVEAQKNEFDAFIAKLDPAGNTLWVRTVGGEANDFGHDVTLTRGGDVALVGYTFGAIDGTALHGVPSKESSDAFFARFSPDGERR